MNDTFLRACRGEDVEYTPVWIMRQAGRYLPEYQKVRAGVDFLTLCKTPELAAEVTLQPVDILGVDAAILFSDILIPLEAMGMKLRFHENKGPVLGNPVRGAGDVERLRVPEPLESVPFVLETIRILRKALSGKVPLIGFAGAPFTLATYMIEGGGSKNFINTKALMYREPEVFHSLMRKITDTTIAYLSSQIEAGAHAVQVFDSWAGALAPDDYAVNSLPYVKETVKALRPFGVPVIYFVNNCGGLLEQARASGADVIGIDWRVDIGEAVKRLGGKVSVQGNLDPCALFSSVDVLRLKVEDILKKGRTARGHVFNLGHGILPQTRPDMARALVDIVHELSRN
ncbi:MAG: uroporphyrinogen decarboxylase [Nitrospirae bacterium]|nr:uroporphyrinogen decarboxylase [Nitrospirota bacterium]